MNIIQNVKVAMEKNLYSCGIISTIIIDSISSALDDSQGRGQYYNRGHRYNLLNP